MTLGERVRGDFPLLQRPMNGKRLVYLDSAVTSQKPREVIDALRHYYETYNANIHRGIYRIAEEATARFEEARAKVAAFLGAARPEEIVFTRGTTEALNLVAATWGRTRVGPGDEILLTEMEHHSNIVPWQFVAAERGAALRYIPVTDEGRLDLAALDRLLTERTKIVALTHQSNVLGTVNPVRLIADRAHAVGAHVVVDAAQSVPHLPVHVGALGADFLAFSGHKMLGPTGTGGLWARYDLLEAMPPYHGGGEMIVLVELDRSTYKDPPHKFEAGTPNIADEIVLGVAVDYLRRIGMEAIAAYEHELTAYALERLREVPGLRIVGPQVALDRGGAISFTMDVAHPHDIAQVLDQEGIAVRAGHHCAQPLHRRFGIAATARASVYLYNTREDIDALVEGLHGVRRLFARSPHPVADPG
ncbi:MAG: cysteine desulfurase [Armatimonadota bacterium]|nr:cysteine desulfurase [Armatimonadota bacterium]MDR7518532.1 cysteine desulfurase [Armatimonadota bacterium]MDR7549820.1 cysteine desulfurase [Armatimonadota bacterium]